MLQFTQQELAALRRRAQKQPTALQRLREAGDAALAHPLQIPQTGVANWFMYYACPDCSMTLEFRWDSPRAHRCPGCGKIYTGEPYDGSWWGQVNQQNAEDAWLLGLLWLLTGQESYARRATDILLGYAAVYPGYEVHGNIPYNGPGKANAQTLDEARFLRGLARGADFLDAYLTPEQKDRLARDLWQPGAEFLRDNRHNQIHNHEVIVDSGIAAMALLLGNEELLHFAVYEPYGILYQLEHGVQADGRWFEGCFGYQFFALESFVDFEIFARHTPYSQMHHPNYLRMLESVYGYLTPAMNFPLENDWHYNHRNLRDMDIYEFFYPVFPTPKMATLLNLAYLGHTRDNLLAFLYGPDQLPAACPWSCSDYLDPAGVGNVVLRAGGGRYLEVKCGTFGGEHDHYDKLGLSYMVGGKPVSIDLGTCSYGAPLHYAYYKNTATHNTVNLGGKNQSPCNGRRLAYRQADGLTYLDVAADWNDPGPRPDSFVICQWDDEAYRGARMRRQIVWCEAFYVDLFLVEQTGTNTINWVQHFKAARRPVPEEREVSSPFAEGPLSYLHDFRTGLSAQVVYEGDGVTTVVHAFPAPSTRCLFALGPDNPSTSDLSYQIEQAQGKQAVFLHVVESYTEASALRELLCDWQPEAVTLTMALATEAGSRHHTIRLPLNWEAAHEN